MLIPTASCIIVILKYLTFYVEICFCYVNKLWLKMCTFIKQLCPIILSRSRTPIHEGYSCIH